MWCYWPITLLAAMWTSSWQNGIASIMILLTLKGVGYEPVTAMKRRIISNHNYFVHCKLELLPFFFSLNFFRAWIFLWDSFASLRNSIHCCLMSQAFGAWPERGVSAVKRIKTRYFYCGSIFFCMMQWTCFPYALLWQVCPSYSRLHSLHKDDKLNVLLQVSITGPTLAEADSIIQQATKVKITPCLTFPLVHTFYNVHDVVFPSVIQISFLSL